MYTARHRQVAMVSSIRDADHAGRMGSQQMCKDSEVQTHARFAAMVTQTALKNNLGTQTTICLQLLPPSKAKACRQLRCMLLFVPRQLRDAADSENQVTSAAAAAHKFHPGLFQVPSVLSGIPLPPRSLRQGLEAMLTVCFSLLSGFALFGGAALPSQAVVPF